MLYMCTVNTISSLSVATGYCLISQDKQDKRDVITTDDDGNDDDEEEEERGHDASITLPR